MASAAAARSIFRSCSGSARGAAARLAPQATSTAKTARSPFRIPTKNSLSNSALRYKHICLNPIFIVSQFSHESLLHYFGTKSKNKVFY